MRAFVCPNCIVPTGSQNRSHLWDSSGVRNNKYVSISESVVLPDPNKMCLKKPRCENEK